MFTSIMAMITAIPKIIDVLTTLVGEVQKLRLSLELKEISDFKKEVQIDLERIKNATNDNDRKSSLLSLSLRLSK